jgi:hypothetical protein
MVLKLLTIPIGPASFQLPPAPHTTSTACNSWVRRRPSTTARPPVARTCATTPTADWPLPLTASAQLARCKCATRPSGLPVADTCRWTLSPWTNTLVAVFGQSGYSASRFSDMRLTGTPRTTSQPGQMTENRPSGGMRRLRQSWRRVNLSPIHF